MKWLCRMLLAVGYAVLGMWLVAAPLVWLLRDGLGPKAVETTGFAAVWKVAPMLVFGAFVVEHLVILHVCEWHLRRRERTVDAQQPTSGGW